MTRLNPAIDSSKPATVLSVGAISKTYFARGKQKEVLRDVTFEVYSNEFVCVVGPSGAGKTTLLRCLAGLLPVSAGQILFEGQRITAPPEKLALVFQDYSRSLLPWLTISSNVSLPLLRNKALSKTEKAQRAAEALAAVGLADCGNLYPWQLSGGMQQRAAIARALAYRPDVLLMDEPFASVDAQTRAELEDLILEVHRRFAVTVVLVTHDIDEAVYLADRVIVVLGSPSSVSEIVPVGLPRPRDQVTTKTHPGFGVLRSHILQGIWRLKADEVLQVTSDGPDPSPAGVVANAPINPLSPREFNEHVR